jgi:cysteinyl-tRNA synthetase
MGIIIYNSLHNRKEELKPINPPKVSMYVCGVTVYDKCHIGHARGSYVFDVVRNYLSYKGYEVTYVKNITDVDDKIIDKAAKLIEEYSKKGINKTLNEAVREITSRYIDAYYADMQALGIKKADIEPKATEHIDAMIEMIQGLIKKGYAYEVEGDVYFDINKYKDYGCLSNQSIEELQEGVRKETDKKKKNALDFALWKKVKENEPYWDSPFSKGRPGWHLECSVMSIKYLGKNFDIHGGGRDLIFPHHENEVAQSVCYTGKPFANIWMHNGLLTISGQKMAKSLGNFVTIEDVLKKYDPEVLKIFFLSSHYASPIDFSYDKMEGMKTSRERFYTLFNKIDRFETECPKQERKSKDLKEVATAKLNEYTQVFDKARTDFEAAMDDDFNTPAALAVMHEVVNVANKLIAEEQIDTCHKLPLLKSVKYSLKEVGRILGLFNIKTEEKEEDMETLAKVIEILIDLRNKARRDKDFKLADEIRDQLDKAGIIIEDEKEKTLWRKK